MPEPRTALIELSESLWVADRPQRFHGLEGGPR